MKEIEIIKKGLIKYSNIQLSVADEKFIKEMLKYSPGILQIKRVTFIKGKNGFIVEYAKPPSHIPYDDKFQAFYANGELKSWRTSAHWDTLKKARMVLDNYLQIN